MKIAVEDYALHQIGGGQKFACLMAESLAERGHKVVLISSQYVDRQFLENYYGVRLDGIGLLVNDRVSGNYDLHIQAEHSAWIPARGRVSVMFCHVPAPNRPLTYLGEYQVILNAGKWSEGFTRRYWRTSKNYVLPLFAKPVEPLKKEKLILTVNRITGHKYLAEMLCVFRRYKWDGWRFVIVGASGWHPEYEESIAETAKGVEGVKILADMSWRDLAVLYGEASIYWHLGGLSDNEFQGESWGMTTAEAMTAGCYVFVPDRGGTSEVVPWGEHHVEDAESLGRATDRVIRRGEMARGAEKLREYALREYSAASFWNRFNSMCIEKKLGMQV